MLIGHKKQWEFFKRKFEENQLSHAYLFVGPKEIGKKMFAVEFAEFIGCKFPDLMILSEANKKDPKFGDGGEIKIAQIREAQNFLSYKSYNGGYKMVIVDDAEKMNQEAQSCFLKTLEEPKGQTLLILVTSKPDMMLETISSRCQTIIFSTPKDLPINSEKAKKEDELLKNLLLAANSDLADKFKYAKAFDFEAQDFGQVLEILQKHLREELLKEVENKGSNLLKIKNLINLVEDLNKKLLFTNASPKLALEILLMEF
jgi:DNA polymerase-3 subunit delta'